LLIIINQLIIKYFLDVQYGDGVGNTVE